MKVAQIKEINSWWNSVYRKIFGYNKWESVKSLISSLRRLDVLHLVNLRKLSFMKKMSVISSPATSFTKILNYFMQSGNCISVLNKYNCQFSWSINKMKVMLCLSLEEQVNSKVLIVV